MATLLLPPIIPPSGPSNSTEILEISDATACASDSLSILLNLDDARFWSTVTASETQAMLGTFLETYLRFGPRQHGLGPRSSDVRQDPNEAPLRRRVLLVLLRLADDARWAEWFTAPRLLDVFALYGFTDGAICASRRGRHAREMAAQGEPGRQAKHLNCRSVGLEGGALASRQAAKVSRICEGDETADPH